MVTLTSPSLTELLQSIEDIKDTHVSPPRPQNPKMSYLLVEELDWETFDRLWHDSNLLKAVTATLWRANRTVIFRIMPNRQHEGLRSRFDEILLRVLLTMHLEPMTHGFRCFRSARVYGDQTTKEPDCSFYPPASLGPGITPSPSLVLEEGEKGDESLIGEAFRLAEDKGSAALWKCVGAIVAIVFTIGLRDVLREVALSEYRLWRSVWKGQSLALRVPAREADAPQKGNPATFGTFGIFGTIGGSSKAGGVLMALSTAYVKYCQKGINDNSRTEMRQMYFKFIL
ncbi:uncharacterized protein N7506_007235 [Penicillium brevicompactum]|uniref:uncharacterized protein n=1 Tax=Penicillium brevicompactum TaxID=5074 RepID=UPI00253FAC2D|nr:uncharacterized protein N7506_007235 [Penicillium brevicompactum]KAJ5333452.1 hypothetical protein N7506_007235 [Penicillium brevicompactum]